MNLDPYWSSWMTNWTQSTMNLFYKKKNGNKKNRKSSKFNNQFWVEIDSQKKKLYSDYVRYHLFESNRCHTQIMCVWCS